MGNIQLFRHIKAVTSVVCACVWAHLQQDDAETVKKNKKIKLPFCHLCVNCIYPYTSTKTFSFEPAFSLDVYMWTGALSGIREEVWFAEERRQMTHTWIPDDAFLMPGSSCSALLLFSLRLFSNALLFSPLMFYFWSMVLKLHDSSLFIFLLIFSYFSFHGYCFKVTWVTNIHQFLILHTSGIPHLKSTSN